MIVVLVVAAALAQEPGPADASAQPAPAPAPAETAPTTAAPPPAELPPPPPNARALTLEDALKLAEDASEDVQVAQAGIESARGSLWQARSGYFPQIAGTIDYSHTFLSEYDGLFTTSTGGGTGGTGGTDGGGLSALPFGKKNTWRWGLSGSQNVWSGGRVAAQMKVAGAQVRNAELNLESARASVALDTAQAYYDATLADRLLAIAQSTLEQSQATYEQTKVSQEVGARPEFDLLRAQVDVENQRVAVLRQQHQRDTSHRRLARLLGVPPDEPLNLVDALQDEPSGDVGDVAARVAGVPTADVPRVPIRIAEENLNVSTSSVKVYRAGGLPSVSLTSQYGWVAYPDSLLPPVDTGEWRDNFTAGFGVTVPLFYGGATHGAVMTARAGVDQAQARVEQSKELADLDTFDARAGLDTAEAQWKATSGTVQQAQRAYEIAEVRFREGVSTQIELADSRLLLEQALTNRAQAARDLQVARIRLALQPSLPIGAGAGTGAYTGAIASPAATAAGAGAATLQPAAATSAAPF